jgi:L-malate glycosyltransferase
MPGLFIERHARSASGCAEIAVLYVHHDDRLTAKSVEIEVSRDDELLEVKVYYRSSRLPVPLLRQLVNLYRFCRYHVTGFKKIREESGRPDLLHVNVLTRLGVIALLYKWMTGTPYLITEHWSRYLPDRNNYHGLFRKILTRRVVKEAAAVMPVTENLRQAMELHGLNNPNYRVIPNVVDLDLFRILEDGPAGEIKNFIHVSCFEDKFKNISGILNVLKRLSEQRTDWICHFVGDGPDLQKMKDYAGELGLGKFAVFYGLKVGEELARMMAEACFLVMFSRFENLPAVILESFACGVPVISTDVGGISEHLHPSMGILTKPGDEKELLEKIDYMLDHYRKYDKKEIRDYAAAHVSREVIGRMLCDVYEESCSRKK